MENEAGTFRVIIFSHSLTDHSDKETTLDRLRTPIKRHHAILPPIALSQYYTFSIENFQISGKLLSIGTLYYTQEMLYTRIVTTYVWDRGQLAGLGFLLPKD